MSKIPKNKAFAFWKYDLFPYLKGGKVQSIGKDAKGEYVTLECNTSFYVEFYMDEKTGQGILHELEEVLALKREEQGKLDRRFNNMVNGLLDEVGEPYRVG